MPVMQAHARELRRMGHSVKAYALEDEYSEIDRPSWEGTELIVHSPLLRRFGYTPRMTAAVRRTCHDLLHQHGLWLYPSVTAWRWKRKTGRPLVISTHGMLEPWALANSRFKKQLAEIFFQRANFAFASCIHCSEAEVEGVRAFGVQTPIAVIPNGVDLVPSEVRPARPPWLPGAGKRLLLFLGRLHPKKGIRETIDAWSILSKTDSALASQWHLAFAGWDDGGYASGYAAHARELGLQNEISFLGPRYGTEKAALLAHADAFILASYSEGHPITILEAWANKLPVFMTRGCNLPIGFHSGSAVEITTNPSEIAKTLSHRLVQDLTGLGSSGYKLVEKRFGWKPAVADLNDVYQWLSGRGSRPGCVITN